MARPGTGRGEKDARNGVTTMTADLLHPLNLALGCAHSPRQIIGTRMAKPEISVEKLTQEEAAAELARLAKRSPLTTGTITPRTRLLSPTPNTTR